MVTRPIYNVADFSIKDTGLRIRNHPILIGSDALGRPVDEKTLTVLDQFLKNNLSPTLVEFLIDYDSGVIVKGAKCG